MSYQIILEFNEISESELNIRKHESGKSFIIEGSLADKYSKDLVQISAKWYPTKNYWILSKKYINILNYLVNIIKNKEMASEENDCTYKNEKKYENIIINYKNILNDRNREIGKLKYLLVENVSNLEKIKKKNVVYEERIGKYKKERRGNDSFLVGILFLIFVTLFIYYEIYDLIYIFLLFNSV